MTKHDYLSKGLTSKQAQKLQDQYGKNQLVPEKESNFFMKILDVLKEPMFLLLLAAAIIYFILGEPKDGAIMLVFVTGVISIDVIQEWKTDKTLKSLKKLSAPHVTVIRDEVEKLIKSEDLVPGDLMIITEGAKVSADGKVIKSNDLCLDESSLTGEFDGVWKVTDADNDSNYWKKDYCYAGTLVTQGSGIILVDKIGLDTEYGKIGENIAKAPEILTPLQLQTNKLVKVCAIIAGVFFVLVCIVTYLNLSDHIFKDKIIESILSGITLAMAMIPEEFPVVLTVFLSMGAWRLAKKKSLVRKLPSVETLGAVSVLCVDKTGTITMNKMAVRQTWSANNNNDELIITMGMACETEPYDPMEKAMLIHCKENNITKEDLFSGELVYEYSFTNESKMMGHVWERNSEITVCAKGSPEKILNLCSYSSDKYDLFQEQIHNMSSSGLRVIAIAKMDIQNNNIPKQLEDCKLELLGLVGLADPPRDGIDADIKSCIKAGIRLVMITGDNGITASCIAKQVGIPNSDKVITGDELDKIDDTELRERIKNVSIFSRVIPVHKMRIVKAFKENGEIVAMTGDGVNDAPALKYADIGISMGERGSEVSREASDLILLDDDFSTIVDTIKDGRRIYDNIRKAVGYIFTIHIPIAFASLLGPILGITSSSLLLLPVHVVLLELIIDPTCSIVLERQPAESNIMHRRPRSPKESMLTSSTLIKSLIQGLVLFGASFGTYYIYLKNDPSQINIARSMGLAIIMISNIFLVQVNSSNTDSSWKSFKNLVKDPIMLAITIGIIVGVGIILYTPISGFLNLAPLNLNQLMIVIVVSLVSVMWYEIVKVIKRISNKIK